MNVRDIATAVLHTRTRERSEHFRGSRGNEVTLRDREADRRSPRAGARGPRCQNVTRSGGPSLKNRETIS